MTTSIEKSPLSTEQAMAMVGKAAGMLAQARTFGEVRAVRDVAKATQVLLVGLECAQAAAIDAGAIQVEAARRLGEFLENREKNQGGRPTEKPGRHDPRVSGPAPKLRELGVSRDQSKRWQKAASVDPKQVEKYVAECRQHNTVPSESGIVSFAKREKHNERWRESAATDKPSVYMAGKIHEPVTQMESRLTSAAKSLTDLRKCSEQVGALARERETAWTQSEIDQAKRVQIELGQLHVATRTFIPVARTIAGNGNAAALPAETQTDLDALQADIIRRAESWPFAPAKFIAVLTRTLTHVRAHFDD